MGSNLGGTRLTLQTNQSRVVILTGPPGVGKTTIILELYNRYTRRGLEVAGMVTQEVRTEGRRVGFRIRDLASGREGWLARVEGSKGPRIGKYTVDTRDLETIGGEAIRIAIEGASRLVLVDEVGPMEMTSKPFREVISRLFRTGKPTVATVKYGSRYQEAEEARLSAGTSMITITPDNRNKVITRIVAHLDTWIGMRDLAC